jgi:hypothetical protein
VTPVNRPDALTWERGFAALASLVRQEFGERYNLVEIATTWGEQVTPEEIEALRELERFGEAGDKLIDNPTERRDVESPDVGD